MASDNNITLPTATVTATTAKSSIVNIILAVVAVAGVGFGGYEFYQNLNHQAEINNPKTKTLTGPSVSYTEKLLEKYVGPGYTTEGYSINAFYQTFASEFSENHKAFLAYYNLDQKDKKDVACTEDYFEKGLCTKKSISYEVYNKIYQNLFGADLNLAKANYNFQNFFYLKYDANLDAYREYIFPGGGTSSLAAVHKVISTDGTENGFIAKVAFFEILTDVQLDSDFHAGDLLSLGVGIKEETIEKAAKSLAVYEFEFTGTEGAHVLTSVKKINQ